MIDDNSVARHLRLLFVLDEPNRTVTLQEKNFAYSQAMQKCNPLMKFQKMRTMMSVTHSF